MQPKPGTQNARLLEWLENVGPITPLDSWRRVGIYRLSARIFDLREMGYDIESTRIKVRNFYGETVRVAEYRLTERDR